ncbi:MAG TPA: bifunctional phosphoribosylaminoimidazolecarboxamide formyltransferase/IMP cyclohydrolase [Xanthomonadales bacterium]|nr:bifunctional phosphoribosylaminoimidazolecarboxamide formyltransferase/IMP cyclohydrolase [Xanthomonadales bacterium]
MASTGGSDEIERQAGNPTSRLALISVSDKTGIIDFARQLHGHGYSLLSTGGTASTLRDAGLDVTDVSEHTGSPEIMDGRVKTLHPKIHGGLLGREGEDEEVMREQEIQRIDMLVLNLYPFEKVTSNPECSFEEAIENIDIGGPAMLRSAAKNFNSVATVTSPDQYQAVIEALEQYGATLPESMRHELAVTAFNRVARYDDAISNWLSSHQPNGESGTFPGQINISHEKMDDLRYGENPHQQAAWYRAPGAVPGSLTSLAQHQGKPLSFNNIADADAAWRCVRQFVTPACVIVKHANPCGVACAADGLAAYERAYATDPTSAFGGVIAFNIPVDGETARTIVQRQFVEIMIAPGYSSEALAHISEKKNLRVLELPIADTDSELDIRCISGGVLVQQGDDVVVSREDCRVVSKRQPTQDEWTDLLFAWRVAKMVKSNAIVYAKDNQSLGVGAGQMSRVDSSRIAAWKAQDAGLSLQGSAMASDAFFPFRDSIDTASKSGVASIIQPGGSMRDDEVIAAADEHDMTMVFTGIRHFRH